MLDIEKKASFLYQLIFLFVCLRVKKRNTAEFPTPPVHTCLEFCLESNYLDIISAVLWWPGRNLNRRLVQTSMAVNAPSLKSTLWPAKIWMPVSQYPITPPSQKIPSWSNDRSYWHLPSYMGWSLCTGQLKPEPTGHHLVLDRSDVAFLSVIHGIRRPLLPVWDVQGVVIGFAWGWNFKPRHLLPNLLTGLESEKGGKKEREGLR